MECIAVIGNAGGGKSKLARALARRHGLPYVEIDALLWRDGWHAAPENESEAEHARLIAEPRWIIDGLGRLESIAARLARASMIVLVDLPLWMHFWLAAERQIAWAKGEIAHPPAGAKQMPPTEDLFRTIFEVDRDWMPEVRRLVAAAEARGWFALPMSRRSRMLRCSDPKSKITGREARRSWVLSGLCYPWVSAARRQVSITEYSSQVRSR
jgi:adenylate kinase family enzyme